MLYDSMGWRSVCPHSRPNPVSKTDFPNVPAIVVVMSLVVISCGEVRQMIVVFRRTGEKRYAVEALRKGLPVVEISPAPGYDRLIPHDMMHLVVEAQLGLTRGIFGQLAAGGNAGSFRLLVEPDQSSREV